MIIIDFSIDSLDHSMFNDLFANILEIVNIKVFIVYLHVLFFTNFFNYDSNHLSMTNFYLIICICMPVPYIDPIQSGRGGSAGGLESAARSSRAAL